jgi:ATP-dependent helicase/nuclease subunit A
VPGLLAFVNDVFDAIEKAPDRSDAFRYGLSDRFPVEASEDQTMQPLGLIVADTIGSAADRVAAEIADLLGEGAIVRDRVTGQRRPVQPADIAILLRSRDSHREYEKALERRGVATYVYKGLGFFDADEVQDAVALLRYLADPLSNIRAATLLRSRIARLSDVGVAALSPALAQAILSPELPAVGLSEDDGRVLARLRAAVPRWLSCVDRLSPLELLDGILAETAYAYETRGAGRRQARENLKKLRGMVARFQNRGYATMARVADHLDELAVGDESNAAIDAVDAVSLMTVHASKGLEFPVVFLVNLGRGTGGVRAPIRVSAAAGEPSVAIADYQSEADEDALGREREETKRLLYVALTRARDRLYLSATVQDGVFRPGRGSLGEVMPASLKALIVQAGVPGAAVVSWTGADRVHTLVVDGHLHNRPLNTVAG